MQAQLVTRPRRSWQSSIATITPIALRHSFSHCDGVLRTPRHVTDIASDEQLIGYAAKAQVALLLTSSPEGTRISQTRLARIADKTAGNFTNELNNPRISEDFLRRLDVAVMTLGPNFDWPGGLLSFASRLRGVQDRRHLHATIPPTWTPDLAAEVPRSDVGVLLQASAFLSTFLSAAGESQRIQQRYAAELQHATRRLVEIGVAPPTQHSIDAITLLGRIASFAFPITRST